MEIDRIQNVPTYLLDRLQFPLSREYIKDTFLKTGKKYFIDICAFVVGSKSHCNYQVNLRTPQTQQILCCNQNSQNKLVELYQKSLPIFLAPKNYYQKNHYQLFSITVGRNVSSVRIFLKIIVHSQSSHIFLKFDSVFFHCGSDFF